MVEKGNNGATLFLCRQFKTLPHSAAHSHGVDDIFFHISEKPYVRKKAELSLPGKPAVSYKMRSVAFRPHLAVGLALSGHDRSQASCVLNTI
jgi:hypothetical protein